MSDLSREDFVVVEGGEQRSIVGFQAEADGPVRVAVLFDISGSMRIGTKAVDAQQTARHIFSSLKKGDKAALFAFDTQLERVTDFTSDFKGLESKVDLRRSAVRANVALRRDCRNGESRRGVDDRRQRSRGSAQRSSC